MFSTPPSDPPDLVPPFDFTRWRTQTAWRLVDASRQLASVRRTLEAVAAAIRERDDRHGLGGLILVAAGFLAELV